MIKNLRLQGRLIACAAVVAVLAIVATISPSLLVMDGLVDRAERRELQSYYENITAAVAAEAAKATALSALVANIPDAQAAMAGGDRDRLAKMFVPAFQALKKDHGAVQMQFHTPPATSFLRVHRPDRFGDDLSSFRHTVVATNSTQKPTQGLEFGVEGLGVRGMVPVLHEGKHIGSFELGMSFGQFFFDSFKQRYGVDVALFVQDKDGMKRFAGTFENESLTRPEHLVTALKGETVVQRIKTTAGPRTALIGAVRDYSGKPFGSVVIAMDSSDYTIAINRAQLIAGIAGLAALAIGVLMAWVIGRNISRPIDAITQTMNRLSGGNLAVALPYQERHDEVGEMARAVAVFKRNAEDKLGLERQQEEERKRFAAEQAAAEQRFEQSIGQVVAAAADGDLSRRVELGGLSGVMQRVGQSVNDMIQRTHAVTNELADVTDALAEGDLTKRVRGDYHGVFGQLKNGANQMAERLRDFARRLAENAEAVKTASAEISSGSQDLAQRTESQAASIEETAASMHEITTTVKQNADNAQAANQLATAARDTAEKGGSVVGDAVSAVSRIEESAQKISDIVGLIDEIAFQTNLLALNASVEAARAGEAGKGFAVVAQEVRALAQRSANASKDIKALIQESNAQVKTGADLVGRTGQSLTEIVASIKKVSDIVAEIAAASREQATGLDQVNTAVGQMDEMTQRNGALVEQTSASAQALAEQAAELAALVGFFRTGDQAAPAVAQSSSARPVAKAVVWKPPAAKPAAAKLASPEASSAKPVIKPADDSDWEEF
ncbi:MAG: methyl-accepting chemotaxis protein [Ferrovibrio sp.]|uniref:methyl-accepting chemotaxis protein n=1 Tax=Ferrovibrio sp. TaxID=1917215 RepID=UPI00391A5135